MGQLYWYLMIWWNRNYSKGAEGWAILMSDYGVDSFLYFSFCATPNSLINPLSRSLCYTFLILRGMIRRSTQITMLSGGGNLFLVYESVARIAFVFVIRAPRIKSVARALEIEEMNAIESSSGLKFSSCVLLFLLATRWLTPRILVFGFLH